MHPRGIEHLITQRVMHYQQLLLHTKLDALRARSWRLLWERGLAAAYGSPQLIAGRIISGIGMSCINSTAPFLQAEVSPKATRGQYACAQLSTLNFGIFLSYWITKNCYKKDEATQGSLRDRNHTLSQAITGFLLATHDTIHCLGKVPVVWEEMVLDEAVPPPTNNTLVTVWRNSSMASLIVQKGYSIIHGASDYSYLDCGLGGWLGTSINDLARDTQPVYFELSMWYPYKALHFIQQIYYFDPYNNIDPAQRKQVLGGHCLGQTPPLGSLRWSLAPQSHYSSFSLRFLFFSTVIGQTSLWFEQTEKQNMGGIICPSALSTVKLYWTNTQQGQSVMEELPCIHNMRYWFLQRGIRAAPCQPHWCAISPGQCNLPPLATEN
ncbi:hypothetical protein PCANC_10820 [Puccinia coronata f. sp. avenae]|uniref:beta-N-acetylhexosaminidase n=2 Tax=Puccinia coronata f. sp. avenae TaxID=200324 RepID=A0A2N5V0X4_9BASI|nr:hypothetical protein PCANC_10820 [Puccinia coronata f. sp. avenae]